MFYTKIQIADDAELITYLTDENVYATCPICGQETLVDISEIFKEEDTDLYGTSVFCDDCADDWLASKNREYQDD